MSVKDSRTRKPQAFEEPIEHCFELLAARPGVGHREEGEEIRLDRFDLRLLVLERLLRGRDLLPVLAPLGFVLVLQARDVVAEVDELADLGHEPACARLVVRPAGGEVLELDHALDDLAPLAQGRLATLIQAGEDGARDLVLVYALAVLGEPLRQVTRERARDAGASEE